MYLEGVSETHRLGQAVLAALQRFDIRSTPDNYALWYEYHAGYSPSLKRTIDTMIANSVPFDEPALRDLHMTFFSSTKDEHAIREISFLIQEKLNYVIKFTG